MPIKKTWIILALALTLRLLLAVTTIHSDLTSAFVLSARYILLDGHWFDFYRFNGSLPLGAVFNYPPLAYLLPNLFYAPFYPLISATANSLIASFPTSAVYLPLLVYKLPMIVADLSIAFFLPQLFTTPKHKYLARTLWLLNPAAIYVSSVLGQVDIIIALLFVLALRELKSHRPLPAAAYLGLSCLFKPVALYLIPILALYYFKKSWQLSLKALLVGFGVYLLGLLPYLRLPEFRYYALFATQNLKSVYAGISISPGYQIPYFFICLALISALVLAGRLKLTLALGLAALSSLIFTHFHPQWFVWLTPWLIFYSVTQNKLSFYFISLIAWTFIVLSFDASLHLGSLLILRSFVWTLNQQFFFQQLVALSRSWLIALFFLSLHRHETKA